MKTSAVITTWNRSVQLHKCLWSLLNGEKVPEEIIVVDDGPSTDNTAETVKNYADMYRDVQISYIVNKREGGWANPSKPRNIGIRMTNPKHELILLSEPEMLLMPDTLRKMVEFFENPPERLEPDWRTPWIPGTVVPPRFFLTASHIGFARVFEVGQGESFKDARACFGGEHVDRRWPEINTRVTLVYRDDLFKIRGWDESMIGWGHDDSDVLHRLHMAGAWHVYLYLPVVHLKHEETKGGGPETDRNAKIANDHIKNQIIAPNDENWGLIRSERSFGVNQSEEQWKSVQESEIESWTTKAWPSKDGKLHRERRYLQAALDDLELSPEQIDAFKTGLVADVGCGPRSILELIESSNEYAFDPLHNGYETIRTENRNGVIYAEGTGESIPLDDGVATAVFTTNSLDHMIEPKKVLQEFWRILGHGGWAHIHVCVNNASEGHPHPAHAIDLTADWLKQVCTDLGFELVREKDTIYGWRHQCSTALVFRKPNLPEVKLQKTRHKGAAQK